MKYHLNPIEQQKVESLERLWQELADEAFNGKCCECRKAYLKRHMDGIKRLQVQKKKLKGGI